jgi:hypothetical protein
MTPDLEARLEALQRLYEKATPGEWRFSPWHIEEGDAAVRAPDGSRLANTANDANAEFIAALHNAWPTLREALRPVAQPVTDADVEAVEAALGHGVGAWDMVDPKEIIRAAWNLYARPEGCPQGWIVHSLGGEAPPTWRICSTRDEVRATISRLVWCDQKSVDQEELDGYMEDFDDESNWSGDPASPDEPGMFWQIQFEIDGIGAMRLDPRAMLSAAPERSE